MQPTPTPTRAPEVTEVTRARSVNDTKAESTIRELAADIGA